MSHDAPYIAGLGGATEAIRFSSHDDLRKAVDHLLTCHSHHFAITGEQEVLSCSPLAVTCLAIVFPGHLSPAPTPAPAR